MYKIENFENILQCSICMDRFQVPKVLPCQHTFCLLCLRRIYNSQRRALDCPTCRNVVHLKADPAELPNNILLISLMDVQPVKAKCPSCNNIDTLTLCEHCHSTKCTQCNEKHIKTIRESTCLALNQLLSTDHTDLQKSVHDAFEKTRQEILKYFQQIRLQQDSILLAKQTDIFRQLDGHKANLLKHVESDLQTLEKSKSETIGKGIDLDQKNEQELLNLATKLAEIQSIFDKKIGEHEKYLNSIEISLQYNPDRFNRIKEMCDDIQLKINETDGNREKSQFQFNNLQESTEITLRTSLNQEYKVRISLDETILKLKEKVSMQVKIDPNRIVLTKVDNYFDRLENERTLRSYECGPTTVLMICVH